MLKATFCFITIWFSAALSNAASGDTAWIASGKGELLRLNLEWAADNHGQIQWQQSADGISWEDIAGAGLKYLRLTADSTRYYRAKVTSGNCDPFYSSLTYLKVIPVSAIKTDSITGTEAVVHITAELSDLVVGNMGLFYDTRPLPDINSPFVTLSGISDSASFRLRNLLPGMKYYTRPFVRLPDGQHALGNILPFTTIKTELLDRLNPTDSGATVWYKITGDTVHASHGIFIAASADPDTNSLKVYGTADERGWMASITQLEPAATYHVMPFIKVFGTYCLGNAKILNTCHDYSQVIQDTSDSEVMHRIVWKPYATAKKISQQGVYADYGRIKRIGNSDTLLLVYHGGPNNQDWVNIYLRKSYDNGESWQNHEIIADINNYSQYWRFCNPELLELQNGWILLAYTANGKPETNENCYIHLLISKDKGITWEGPRLIQTGRSWEPSMVQLPGGEIEMFYSSEARWWPQVPDTYMQQEIHMIRSTDNGITWSFPITVAWYPGKRDGMPVPLLLSGNRGVVFVIETVNSGTSPYIVERGLSEPWTLATSNFENGTHRWLAGYFNGHGGAPYLVQLPTGETVLSVHVYRGGDWHQNNYMQVMIGDRDARNFGKLSTPWGILPVNESAVNNSLFIRNTHSIMAVSGRNFPDGSGGIYWLEGTIETIDQ